MIDRQHIPLFVFAVCLALALALAYFTDAWPTALAIALAGCALGLAMRPPVVEDHDTAFLQEDIAELRAAGERHGDDLAVLKTSMDEMAQIVESLATDMQRIPTGSDPVETENLRAVVDAMGKRIAALDAPQKEAETRLDNLERDIAALRNARAQDGEVTDFRTVEPVALAASAQSAVSGGAMSMPMETTVASGGGSISERAERLRERFSRGRGARQVRAVPLFDRVRAPASLMVESPDDPVSVEGGIAAIRQALALVGASEDPEARIFVRLSKDVIADSAMSDALPPVLEEAENAVHRLVVVVPQSSVQGGPPRALAMLLKAGARFGLERMMDWSADLDALAGRGLAVIMVDGPAMAKSAVSQKGDPTRLRQVLHARGIELLAGDIETRMQLDAVNTLVPDLLAGPGLGEATLMDVPE